MVMGGCRATQRVCQKVLTDRAPVGGAPCPRSRRRRRRRVNRALGGRSGTCPRGGLLQSEDNLRFAAHPRPSALAAANCSPEVPARRFYRFLRIAGARTGSCDGVIWPVGRPGPIAGPLGAALTPARDSCARQAEFPILTRLARSQFLDNAPRPGGNYATPSIIVAKEHTLPANVPNPPLQRDPLA